MRTKFINVSRKKNLPILENITVVDVAAEGKSIARVENKVLFLTHCIPGDVVDVQLTRKRTGFLEGRVIRLVTPSPMRVDPFCSHFGVCGGCKWQNLPYAEQLKFKQKQVIDQFTRIGHLQIPEVSPILGSAKTDHYRNKLEYTFSNRRWLTSDEMNQEDRNNNGVGFHIPGMFDKVLDIDTCHLQDEPSNEIRNAIRQFALKNDYTFFDLRAQQGFLRTLIVRNTSGGQWMVILVFHYDDRELRETLLDFLATEFPQITSLMYVINPKANDTIGDLDVVCYKGQDYITEEMEGLQFKIGPKSFYQTNSQQAYELYKVTREFAGLTGSEVVYDLYTGTGTIANFVARNAQKVVGVEYVPEAIEDAFVNSKLNGITNTSFFAGDMKDVINPAFIAQHGKPDVVILDPPRAGVHEKVLECLLEAAPKRMVYVSCNPATQARDIALLSGTYRVTHIQPVDMFPHTHHVENVALLERI